MTGVPDAHREIVRGVLATCFGSTPVDAVVPVVAGASARAILRVDAGGRRYALRVEGPRSPLRYPHQYVALRMAAEAGVAPKVHHVDEVAGVALTDFIETRPLSTYPGGARALVQAMGELLGRLHATPVFPRFVSYPDIVARLFAHVRRTGLFAPGMLDRHVECLEQLRSAYAWDPADSISCHNDCLLGNILFDGVRLWLIDWESAYPNDPLVDIAIQLDNLARSRDLEEVLLRAWLGRAPDEAMRERLAQARALTRLYYAGVLLSVSAKYPRSIPDADLTAPTVTELEAAIRDGRYQYGTPQTIHVMGKMYLNGFLTAAAVPPLAEI